MRAGVDTAIARVMNVLGEARAHHAYLFVNKRANRTKVFVHDGFGLWLCARRLYEGGFIRAAARHVRGMPLSHEQLQAIVVGLPWERLDERTKIRVLWKNMLSMLISRQLWQDRSPWSCRDRSLRWTQKSREEPQGLTATLLA
jgi:hypothetical protein